MLKEIEQLLVLQDRDQKIKVLKAELEVIPLEQKRVEDNVAAKTQALENIKQRSRELELQRKKFELDARSRRDSIAKYKGQQFQTRKNEEFQALGLEIQRMEKEIQATEDQEIELMEQNEIAHQEIMQAERSFKILKAQAEQQVAGLKQKKANFENSLRQTEAEREQLSQSIDPNLLFRYNRLFLSKGGDAVVPIEHEVCMGCHMKNTTTLVHRVKLEREIVHCEQCGRMLYYLP
ncbi:MAG: hypothetical protein JO076_11885 [Verrucomicrobia bacterium]|nr:hypothetical protein [Verrucomicrobiota bacterium]